MKTTKAHFTIFKREVKRWISLFGLISWEKHIDHAETDEDALSTAMVNFPARLFVITLNKEWLNPITTDGLKDAALHEVLEVLLWRLESMAVKGMKEDAREEVHAIIQTLINVLRG